MEELNEARKIIDETDSEIAKLFCRRMEAAKTIAAYKGARGLPILDAERESAVLARGAARVPDEELRSFYLLFQKEVMAVSRAYQRKLLQGERVAYAGTVGAFAHLAVRRLFPEATAVPYADFASAWEAVESGACELAVLPIENSFQGEVGSVTDLMFSGSLFLNAVTEMPITQDLLAKPGTTSPRSERSSATRRLSDNARHISVRTGLRWRNMQTRLLRRNMWRRARTGQSPPLPRRRRQTSSVFRFSKATFIRKQQTRRALPSFPVRRTLLPRRRAACARCFCSRCRTVRARSPRQSTSSARTASTFAPSAVAR